MHLTSTVRSLRYDNVYSWSIPLAANNPHNNFSSTFPLFRTIVTLRRKHYTIITILRYRYKALDRRGKNTIIIAVLLHRARAAEKRLNSRGNVDNAFRTWNRRIRGRESCSASFAPRDRTSSLLGSQVRRAYQLD